ncbi:MAG TPA: tRNA (adenosine(37)-N6)-threonylcarbamoyltransferase complex ATPase subunit type 1 TsaE, partial [Clostridiaceae bacterium]|nr:tRNA (adenosine(37)-N6)-threonylcarbamoyltransferase complex ATPase subunit type 1 TsaE [Clostridiaceae bacterium]
MISIRTMSEKETGDVGFKLGRIIKNGDIVCLTGELGAGKTVFVKGIASALNVDEYITSPTFTIVNEYNNGKFPVYHFDVYRI